MTKELQAKIDRAVKLLQLVARDYDKPAEIAYSGGKDSDVILQLAKYAFLAGADWAQEQLIEKASQWLWQQVIDADLIEGSRNVELLLEQFKKAMKVK